MVLVVEIEISKIVVLTIIVEVLDQLSQWSHNSTVSS